jgi:hypothetical protein
MSLARNRLILGNVWLPGPERKHLTPSTVDRYVVAARFPADYFGDRSSLLNVTGNRSDSQKIAARLAQQIGKGDGIVNIASDIRVEKHGNAFH